MNVAQSKHVYCWLRTWTQQSKQPLRLAILCKKTFLKKEGYIFVVFLFYSSYFSAVHVLLKFIYSEKATKFWEIFTLLLSYVVQVKSKVKISQNFLAFSEYMNFKGEVLWDKILTWNMFLVHYKLLGFRNLHEKSENIFLTKTPKGASLSHLLLLLYHTFEHNWIFLPLCMNLHYVLLS